MSKYSVFMTDSIFPDTDIEEKELASIDATLTLSSRQDPSTYLEEGKDCDAMLVVYAPVGADVIEGLTRCKVIVRTGIGVNNIDIEAASRKGIMVANVPDYCIDEVADHTIALFLSGVRKINFLNSRVREGVWNVNEASPIPRLRGKIYGLLGCGAIGQRVAERAAAFGMEVVGFDPFVPDEVMAQAGIRRICDLDSFFASVDAFSLHVPLTEETHHIINRKNLEKMKDSAFVVNTSRGPLVNEKELFDALKEGVIAGAALDVLEKEPPEGIHPLAELPNVIITPHAAFFSDGAVPELRLKAAREIVRTLTEGQPKFWVNRKQMGQ
ncbi:MAG TPA: C-terminal binding protein [Synergistales bacterium]|nr:C-terminal binding protein [Synergistales bacterium]HQO83209.1 C-terminal binding protein [Synergistales bacterium]HQQ11288.1 C-terminal binding protein [Synergistales bacterium]